MSDQTPQDLFDLAPAYAMGALDAAETAAFEQALATDPALAAEVAAFREVAGLVGTAAPAIAPPTGLRDRVLATTPVAAPTTDSVRPITSAPSAVASRQRPGLAWWGALAASVALLGVTTVQLREAQDGLRAAESALADEAARARTLAQDLAARERTLQSLLAPGVTRVRLSKDGTAEAQIDLFVNPTSRRVVLYASNLPAVEAGKVYQLWFIRGTEAPMPSVTFRTDAQGVGLLDEITLPEGDLPAVAAVTVEPEGGSASPTMPIIVLGKFTE